MFLEVRVGDHVDLVALPLGPLDERTTPVGPARRAAVRRQVVHPEIAHMAGRLVVRWMDRGDPLTRARRLVQVARCHRAQHRRLRGAGVEVASAEVVVRMPRVGVDRPQDLRRRGGKVWPYDEEGSARAQLGVDVDRQQDLVVAGAPVRVGDDVGRHGPTAAVLRRIGRSRMVAGRNVGLEMHDLAHHSEARHLDRHRPASRRREMQRHALPRRHRLRPAVPVHRLVRHGPTLRGKSHRRRVRPIPSWAPWPTSPPACSSSDQPSDASSPARDRSASATSTPGRGSASIRSPATCRTSPRMTPPTPSSTTPSAGWCAAR